MRARLALAAALASVLAGTMPGALWGANAATRPGISSN